MTRQHDRTFKLIFSFRGMVEWLLLECGFYVGVPAGFTDNIHFDTLIQVPSNYVTDDSKEGEEAAEPLAERVGDQLWRVEYTTVNSRGEVVRKVLYIAIEFQSRIERDMTFRIAKYVQMIREDMRHRGEFMPGDEMPLILPIVIYRGNARWIIGDDNFASREWESISAFEQALKGGGLFGLLDMQSYAHEEAGRRDLMSKWSRLERADKGTAMSWLILEIYLLIEEFQLEDEVKRELRRAFYRRALNLNIMWNENGDELSFNELEMVYQGGTMQEYVEGNYEKRVIRLCGEARDEGREEGRDEGIKVGISRGREEGREEGLVRERKLLRRQAMSRFNAEAADQLEKLLDRINDPARLEDVGEWLVNGYTESEFLRRVEGLIP